MMIGLSLVPERLSVSDSSYVPALTRMRSPALAALNADWMVEYCPPLLTVSVRPPEGAGVGVGVGEGVGVGVGVGDGVEPPPLLMTVKWTVTFVPAMPAAFFSE